MHKNITKILLLMLICTTFTLSGCSSKEETSTTDIQPKHFLKQYDGSDSKIFKDCRKDSDCRLEFSGFHCRPYMSININSTQIDEYLKGDGKYHGCRYCKRYPYEMDDLKAVCSNNVCQVKVKTIPKLLNFITTKHSLEDIKDYFNNLLLNS